MLGKAGEFDLTKYLARAEQVILPSQMKITSPAPVDDRPFYIGADLGTAYLVLVVLDEKLQPVAGEFQFAQVVKDGLVQDFSGIPTHVPEKPLFVTPIDIPMQYAQKAAEME